MKSTTEYARNEFKKIIQRRLDIYDQEFIAIILREYKREVIAEWLREAMNEGISCQ